MATKRLALMAAATAGLLMTGTSLAAAHHCYKDAWTDAAHERLSAGGTAWVSLSDLGTMFIIGPEYAEQCGYVADDVVEAWMDDRGLTQEPLIHSKATTGGGAFYHKGKAPKPFEYLSEEDFGALTMGIIAGMETCDSDWMPPPME